MAILGITNRTENWKTALYFSPLMGVRAARLARQLLPDEEGAKLQAGDVNLELFWYGMRDYVYREGTQPAEEELASLYQESFSQLQAQIGSFRNLRLPDGAYSVSARRSKLKSNLLNTEVDIVLESPKHLFIGEAKHESNFGASGDDVLVHQLIRQYVMASILLKLCGRDLTVVPFVVGDSRKTLKKYGQVQFMLEHMEMREANILEWGDIEALW